MGKRKGNTGLGRSIIRDRFGPRGAGGGRHGESYLHTSELSDGYDWGRLNLQSVTEQSSLDDFLATAALAGTEFEAEKLNIKFVNPDVNVGLLTEEEEKEVQKAQEDNRQYISIPRRPAWDETTSADELQRRERDSFLEWRRQLARLQDKEHIILTPFEKNLEFWRQLWRVIERSDIIVQIVDGRNPLLFRCQDLEKYVKEIDKDKMNMILVNKADLLTETQRRVWAEYFGSRGVKVAFWSAMEETDRQGAKDLEEVAEHQEVVEEDDMEEGGTEEVEEPDDEDMASSDSERHQESEDHIRTSPSETELVQELQDVQVLDTERPTVVGVDQTVSNDPQPIRDREEAVARQEDEEEDVQTADSIEDHSALPDSSVEQHSDGNMEATQTEEQLTQETVPLQTGSVDRATASSEQQRDNCSVGNSVEHAVQNSSVLLTGEELLQLFKDLSPQETQEEGVTTVGLVGYPNVGKSSTINALLKCKKVPVSATPGRTKHFQTLYVDETLLLCDCPGLVMPTFVSTKAEMVVSGILPIDQMRDHLPPTSLVCRHIPRHVLERTYGVNLPAPAEGEDPDRLPTANELLNAYGAMRGFMTAHGQPDTPRSARYILKDYVNGKLLYCHPPPGVDPEEFQIWNDQSTGPASTDGHKHSTSKAQQKTKGHQPAPMSKVDKEFFSKHNVRAITKGAQVPQASNQSTNHQSLSGKPWKKHFNKNKKEKARRVFKHLDE
ncbi:large subunit GTPase 1 homolog [Branchiostoma floridae]|uniref:Large subunit GTPase 1 homolog n=2 Tax=Branchiostoma floridae TaxID=7739 RepID=A0A9J7NA65_BRAFL|nr:large subunit GTPase 1 homolog [Branchiostoma floridae]